MARRQNALGTRILRKRRSGYRWGRVPLPMQPDRSVCETDDIHTGAAHVFRAVWHGGCSVSSSMNSEFPNKPGKPPPPTPIDPDESEPPSYDDPPRPTTISQFRKQTIILAVCSDPKPSYDSPDRTPTARIPLDIRAEYIGLLACTHLNFKLGCDGSVEN